MKVIFNFILFLISISFITAVRLDVIFYFDILILIYIIFIIFTHKTCKVNKFTINLISFLMLILFVPLVLSFFSNDQVESFKFLSQYLFLIIFIPLFVDFLIKYNHLDIFLKMTFYLLLISSFLYFAFILYGEKTILLYFKDDLFGYRFAVEGFTYNEMGHYVLFLFFINYIYFKENVIYRLFIPLAYIMTFSKTVWIQIGLYYLKFKLMSFIIFLICLFLIFYFEFYQTIIDFILFDFSTDSESNQSRIEMLSQAWNNLPNTIFAPAYHSDLNIESVYVNAISTHNFIFSYFTNFGLVSFLILFMGIVYIVFKNIKKYGFNYIYIFIILDFLLLMLQPIINARLLWLPLFIYIYFIGLHLKDGNRYA